MTMVDPYATTNALARGYDQMQGMATDRARMTAGNALAGGNTQGAIAALGGVGDLQGQRTLLADQQQAEQRSLEQQEADKKEARDFLLQGGMGLMQAPYEARQQLYVEVLRPTLEQMDLPPEYLAQLDQTDKSDQNLGAWITALGGELPQRPGGMNVGGGRIVERDRYTGEYREVYQAPVDPLDAEYRQAQIDALRAQQEQRQAQAARARRPASSGGGGGSGRGGGSRAAPAAINPSGVRWD